MNNLICVDRGALTMAKNALERAGKNEIKDALIESAIPIEDLLKQVANDSPALLRKDEIMGALARGYCSKENEKKELDATLILAMTDEVMKLLDE